MNLVMHLMSMRLGQRVCAPQEIVYADTGVVIPEGTRGRVVAVTCCGAVVEVAWDGRDDALRTSFDSLAEVPS